MTLHRRMAIAWIGLLATVAVSLILGFGQSPVAAQQALAIVIATVAVLTFGAHGGHKITVTGLFSLSVGLFMGYGGWVVADGRPAMTAVLSYTAVTLSLCVLFFRYRAPEEPLTTEAPAARTFVAVGVLSMAVLVVARDVLPLTDGAAAMSTLIFGIGLIFGPERTARWTPVLLLPHILLYSEVFHGSTGRLRLVALVGALALMYTARFPRRWTKPAVLAALPPALVYLARDRLAHQEATYGLGASAGRTGLESMVTPPRAFAALLRAQDKGVGPDLQWGASFFSPLTSIAPDWILPGWTPHVFNYELVAYVTPGRYGSGFSTAGSYFGEWWWNFGLLGLLLAVLLTGPLLGILDRTMHNALDRIGDKPFSPVILCAAVAFGGAVADLAWAGPHTWIVRGLARLPLLIVVTPLLLMKPARGRAQRWPKRDRELDHIRQRRARARLAGLSP